MEPYVDEEIEPNQELNRITDMIIGAAIAVHRELGPGFGETVYRNALALEFRACNVPFAMEHPITVNYREQPVGEFRLDFLVENSIIIELKSVDSLASVHTAQMISYLRATKQKLGLLINFNVKKLVDGIRRIAN